MVKRSRIVLAVILIVAASGFYPFNSIDVPSWKLRVVDEHGVPYAGKEVTQAWKNYTLETEAGQNFDTRKTDEQGYVEFPARKTRAGLWRRTFLTVMRGALTLAHGGFGVHAYVHANGPQGYGSVEYVSGQDLPNTLVLPTTDKD